MSITNLTNTRWRFNETVDFTALSIPVGGSAIYSVNFTTVGPSPSYLQVYIYANGGRLRYGGTQVYIGLSNTWSKNGYREIFITGGTDATNATLIAWLESTATLIDRYYVDKADLVSVADAIRAKGGTSEPLTFPDGFIEAINNL